MDCALKWYYGRCQKSTHC